MYKKYLLCLLLIFSIHSTVDTTNKESHDYLFEEEENDNNNFVKNFEGSKLMKAMSFDKIARGIAENLNGKFSIEFTKSSLNKIEKYMCMPQKIKIQRVQTSKNLFKATCVFDGVYVFLYGSFFNVIQIPVVNKTTNDLITEKDISLKYVRSDSINDRVIKIPQNIIGLKLSKNYKPLTPIYDTDLSKPDIIKKNTKVIISIKTKNLRLETPGQLTENAQLNQIASVLNLQSKRVIDCIVKSPTEVTPVGF